MELNIRIMREEDISAVSEIERDVFSEPWDDSFFSEMLLKHMNYVMICDNELISYMILIVEKKIGYIANFAIKKNFQNQGLGAKFLLFILIKAKQAGCLILYLDVRSSNEKAIKLYKKYGFLEFRRVPNYYSIPQEDAIQMVIKLRKI
jgi:ribosomal-protein-alanine N-acetyltransferase